jgi:hypothetical protein
MPSAPLRPNKPKANLRLQLACVLAAFSLGSILTATGSVAATAEDPASRWIGLGDLAGRRHLPTASFLPDGGRGTYSFQSRVRRVTNDEATWFSEDVSIAVS